MDMINIFLNGLLVSIALIVAIGAQNAFVLKKGLEKNNVFWVCLTCFLCDFFLIVLGIFGLGDLINKNLYLSIFLSLAGSIFLFWYGFNSFKNAIKGNETIQIDTFKEKNKQSIKKSIYTTLAITLLNPHVYIDTVVVIGGVTNSLTFIQKTFFTLGALFTSFLWFFSLGYGASFLIPLFKKRVTWRILDSIIGIIMWYIALNLLIHTFVNLKF